MLRGQQPNYDKDECMKPPNNNKEEVKTDYKCRHFFSNKTKDLIKMNAC